MKLADMISRKELNEIALQSMESDANPIMILNKSGRIIWFNEAFTNLLGYSNKDLGNLYVWNIDENISENSWTGLWDQFIKKTVFSIKIVIIRKNDEKIDLIATVHNVQYRNETILFLYLQEITKVEPLKKEMTKSEERYETFIKNYQGIAYIAGIDWIPKFIKGDVKGITGYTEDELLMGNPPWYKVIHPDDLIWIRECDKELKGIPGTKKNGEYRIIKKDGTIVWVRDTLQNVCDEDGRPYLLVGSITDITERKRIEKELLNSEERYRALTETSKDAILIINRDLNLSFVNQAAASYFSDTPENIIGKPLDYILPTEYVDKYKKSILKIIERGNPEEFDIMYKLPGGMRWFDIRIIPLKDNGCTENCFFIYATDVHERKSIEDALYSANKKLNMLTTVVRHDILNYLTMCDSCIHLLQMKFEDAQIRDEQICEYLKNMHFGTRSIEKLIDFTREYQSLGIEKPKWQNVNHIVEDLKNEPLFSGINITDTSDNVEIFADALLNRVFFNLFENSLRHGIDVNKTEVSSYEQKGQLVVVVEDDGIGIPTENKAKIFNEHFGKHTGLGLFLVREILSITGITISETGTPGKGARFIIIVPQGNWKKKS